MTEPNQKLLINLIKDSFPDVACKTYRYIDEGWDHQIMIVDNRLVFRFPMDDEYAKLLKTEISVLNRLKSQVSINIPEYSHISRDISFAGYPLIPGKSLIPKHFNTLSKHARNCFAKQLAEFLSTIHTLNKNDFKDVKPSNMLQWQTEVKESCHTHLKSMLSTNDMLKVYAILERIDKLLECSYQPVFLHGDIYSRHLLWDEHTEQLGLIDFSDMNLGDPAFDFAELYEYGKDFVNKIYRYYAGPKEDTFLERAFIYQQWVGVFMMADYFINHKTPFEIARRTFDQFKS